MILKFSQTLFQNMQHQIYNELTLSLIFSFHFPVCQRPFGFPLLFWSWRSVCGGSLSKSCFLLNGRGFSFRLRSCYHLRRFLASFRFIGSLGSFPFRHPLPCIFKVRNLQEFFAFRGSFRSQIFCKGRLIFYICKLNLNKI